MENITFENLAPLLPIYVKENLVPFIAGEPGIGKSASIKQLAKKLNTKCFVLSVNQLGTREDLTGARSLKDPKTDTYRQVFFPHAIIQDAIDYAKSHQDETPILFLDEINRTSPDVTSAILALITERRIGTTNLPKNIRIIAAGNDHGNVNSLDTASISRMAIFHVKPDIQKFINCQPNLNFYIKKLLTQHPDLLVQTKPTENSQDHQKDNNNSFSPDELDYLNGDSMQQITVPRTLTYLSDFLNAVGLTGQSLPDNLTTIYDPFNTQHSPLKYAVYAQLGHTQTADLLYQNITDSIEQLSSQNTNQTNTQIKLPRPNQNVIKLVTNATSKNDIDELIYSSHFNKQTLSDTFFSLTNPNVYNQDPQAVKDYYTDLADSLSQSHNKQVQISFAKTYTKLYQNGQIITPICQLIQKSQDNLSKRLNIIMTTLGN